MCQLHISYLAMNKYVFLDLTAKNLHSSKATVYGPEEAHILNVHILKTNKHGVRLEWHRDKTWTRDERNPSSRVCVSSLKTLRLTTRSILKPTDSQRHNKRPQCSSNPFNSARRAYLNETQARNIKSSQPKNNTIVYTKTTVTVF